MSDWNLTIQKMFAKEKEVAKAKRHKVFIVGGDGLIERMFTSRGWEVVDHYLKADLVQFTGGADVDPRLYGEVNEGLSYCNIERDRHERSLFLDIIDRDEDESIRMAGICRGAQFLNVMCGGAMYQDVEKHAIGGTHPLTDFMTDRRIEVTSTHHQLMIAHKSADLVAHANLRGKRSDPPKELGDRWIEPALDPEVLFYIKQKVLAFQPHPEYNHKPTEDYYFELLERKLGFS